MFRRSAGIWAALFLCGVGMTVAAGCGWSEKRAARTAATAFLEAANHGDTPALERRLTTKARINAASLEAFLNRVENSEHGGHGEHGSGERTESVTVYEVGEPSIEEGIATVPVRFKDADGETPGRIRLKREENEWRVYAVAAEFLPGKPYIEFNLESPDGLFVEMMRGVGQGVGQALRAGEEGMRGFLEGLEKGLRTTPGAEIREMPTPPAAERL